MDLSPLIDSIVTLLGNNLLISIALAILLIIMLFRKPKLFFMIFFITLFLGAVLYMIFSVSSTAVSEKKALINKSARDLPTE